MWVVEPTLLDVPKPNLIPHDDHAKDEAVRVVNASPAILAELHKSRWLVLGFSSSPPSLDLPLREVQLLRETQQLRTKEIWFYDSR